jgi:predicted transposase YdaD
MNRSEALPAATQYVDLLVEVAPGYLVQVEFVRTPSTDMALRMLEYYARITRAYPGYALTQHVLVLAQGTTPPRFASPEATLTFHVTYLRDEDPEDYLAVPSLAPLAVLTRACDQQERIKLLQRALDVVTGLSDPAYRRDQIDVTMTLAGIYLDPTTINTTAQEAGMPFTLDEDTVAGRIIAAQAEARGRVEGEARGRVEGEARGEARGRAEMLAALLRHTHGDDPRIPALAERLAHLPQREQATEAALTAATLDELTTFADTHSE